MIKVNIGETQYKVELFNVIKLFYGYNEVELTDEKGTYNIEFKSNVIIGDGKNCPQFTYAFNKDITYRENLKRGIYLFFKAVTKKSPPWGTLTGIRPTKRVIGMLRENASDEKILKTLTDDFCCSPSKAELSLEVAKSEIRFVNEEKDIVGIYIGMPFCPTRCLYCSFTSNPIKSCNNMVDPYLEALKKEISTISEYIKEKNLTIETVYFGGGTPTSVNNEQFEGIIKEVYNSFIKEKSVKEFTIECGRPDSITAEKLKAMKKYKVTRISINPQTMNEDTLKAIGRHHTVNEIKDKFNLARNLGFDNINMDIIIGLPNETLENVKVTCRELLALRPDSLTVHGLSIKRGSRLHEDILNKKRYSVAKNQEIEKMYEEVQNLSEKLNMKPYYMYRQKNMVGNMENLGYSTLEKECIYNVQMIQEKQTIIALGADAISKVVFLEENRHERFANLKDVHEYTNRIDELLEKKVDFLNTLYK